MGKFSAETIVKLYPWLSYCRLLSHHILLLSPSPFNLASGNKLGDSAVGEKWACLCLWGRGEFVEGLKFALWNQQALQGPPGENVSGVLQFCVASLRFLWRQAPRNLKTWLIFLILQQISCLAQPWASP